ncbi:cramped chromatin regulator [Arctopsyche grandis]|uniref:cramped chromatin regulator n=1 Tax=Arctopsyche grandis TaxID=121162 RepID=UPI00406D7436
MWGNFADGTELFFDQFHSSSKRNLNFQPDVNVVIYCFMMNNEKIRSKTDANVEPVEELLGSLTTYNGIQRGESPGQTVRTSARVFKKMRQDSSQTQPTTSSVSTVLDTSEKDKKDTKHETLEKNEEESGILPLNVPGLVNRQPISTAKQRMPKALWSTREKNLFFEALNEYGKDFDSITSYIHNKMKKKGVPDNITKNKHQVSHFYYRTWQKVSKYVKFGDDVKKVVQELYALINYGEMKKRLVSGVAARAILRLSELVWHGVVAVRTGGRTVRVRTPICRALRRLNKLEEWEENLRLPSRVVVCLNPRDMEAWSRVHAAAHNPRVLLAVAPSRRLAPVLTLLQRRWLMPTDFVRESLVASSEIKEIDFCNSVEQQINLVLNPNTQNTLTLNKLPISPNIQSSTIHDSNLDNKKDKNCPPKTDEIIVLDEDGVQKSNGKVSNLEKDECEEVELNLNTVVEGKIRNEDLSSSKNDGNTKNVDGSKKEEIEKDISSNLLLENSKELFLHVGPKPGTDINIPTVNVSEHLTSHRISLSIYQERLGTGSLCTQNPAYHSGGCIKVGGRFKTHKRQRKDSGDNDTTKKHKVESDNWDKNENFNIFDVDETANDGMNGSLIEHRSDSIPKEVMSDEKSIDEKDFNDFRDKEIYSEHEYEHNETDGECDAAVKSLKYPKVALKGKAKKEKEPNATNNRESISNNDNVDESGKLSNTFSGFIKKNWNRDLLMEQIQKGWSCYDAGDLTIGDLYLMFGNESKLDMNYWWAKGTLPIGDDMIQNTKQSTEPCDVTTKESEISNSQSVGNEDKGKVNNQDGTLQSIIILESHTDDNRQESDVMSPDPKQTLYSCVEDEPNMTSLNLVTKIVNNPCSSSNQSAQAVSDSNSSAAPLVVKQREQVVTLATRLKKLLSLSQLYAKKGPTSCLCGHVCSGLRGRKSYSGNVTDVNVSDATGPKFPTQRVITKDKLNAFNKKQPSVNIQDQPSSSKNVTGPSHYGQTPTITSKMFDLQAIPSRITKKVVKPKFTVIGSELKPVDDIPSTSDESPIILNPNNENNSASQEVFRTPFSKSNVTSRLQPYGQSQPARNQIDFSGLPRWTNRRGRKPKKAVVVRQLLPLAPWPPQVINVASTSKLYQVKPLPVLQKLPQIRPALSMKMILPTENLPKIIAVKGANTKDDEAVSADKPDDKQNIISFKPEVTLFGTSPNSNVDRPADNEKGVIREGSSCISNLLDISLPSNIGDEISIDVSSIKTEDIYVADKHDDFSVVGLLKNESIPSMSPSHLLKENDEHWLTSGVGDFSLSSFLGHLEGTPLTSVKTDASSSLKDSSSAPSSHVDTQLQCLMSETSIDYMAKFADLAAQVAADNSK